MRPNILLITADHMRSDAIGANVNPFVQTPNLDALAERGVTFTNAFSPNPICVPGRASITTGNYPHKCTGHKSNSGCIRDDQVKLAEHFNAAGYWTAAIGKLHYVPYSPPGQPRLLHGFQYCELCESGRIVGLYDPTGQTRGLEDYHDYLQDVGWGGYQRAHGIGNNDVHAAASALPAEHHEEAWVGSRSVANLERHLRDNPDQPFMMWTSFAKPHSPYDPPEPYNRLYDPRALPSPIGSYGLLAHRDPLIRSWPVAYGWDKLSPQGVQHSRAHYYGLVTFQDEQIGRIVRCLDQAGQLDNTIIIYSSDHGDLLGDFGCFFKCNMFNGSVNVRLVCAGPGITPQGQNAELTGLQDILPTLAGLTGLPLPQSVDGEDLSPLLSNANARGREFYVSQSLASPTQRYMLRTRQFKYVYHELGGVEELYDEVEDPQELRNLGAERPAVVSELRGALTDWCRENGDEEIFDGSDLKVSPEDAAQVTAFEARRMGWRWY
jgi:arylsulfatase A-like enzyme